MAKNNQKREKAKRNLENAKKYKKRPVFSRNRRPGGPRPAGSSPLSPDTPDTPSA